ncbi:MAG: hypothetical protein IKS98_05625 [Lachnospiraceae bacterium]|nr:hypothetical protein [Lachnospiraceae bacterium]
MNKTFVCRFFAVLACVILIVLNLSPVAVNAGLFDESWFQEWNDIYGDGFESVGETATNFVPENETDAEKSVRRVIRDIYSNLGSHVTKEYAADIGNSFVAYSYYGMNFSEYANLTADQRDTLVESIYGIWLFPLLEGYVERVSGIISNINNAEEADRASLIVGLNEAIEEINREGFNGSTDFMRSRLETKLQYEAGFFYDIAVALKDGSFVPGEYYIYNGYELTNLLDGTTSRFKEDLQKIPSVSREKFQDMVVDYWFRRIDYLVSVENSVGEVYASVPEGYFDDVISSEDDNDPGVIEKNLSKLLINVSSSLKGLLDTHTIRFENIIYGRVKTTGGIALGVNNFSFELENKNMYGITGSIIYVILRGIFIIALLVFFMYYLAKESFISSARERSKLKQNLGFILLSLLLMYAMPNIIDALIHVRDAILYELSQSIGQSAFSSMAELSKQFKELAVKSKSIVDAFEYFGMVIITIYLAFVYIGMACSMTVMFAFFPLFVVFSFRDHKILSEWFTFVLGVITTPLIDAVLFLLPLIATQMRSSPDLVKFLLCLSIIPARGMVRRMLGFSSSAGAELVGLGAIMAGGRAIGSMARAAKNTASNVVSGVSSVHADRSAARLHEGLAELESSGSETGSGALSGVSFGAAFGGDVASSPLSGTVRNIERASERAGGTGFGGISPSPAVSAVYKKNAGLGTFDKPGFNNNLDHETMAKMYRQRARMTAAQTMFRTAGSVQGGLAGGALGIGAGTFLGSNAAMMMGGMGAAAGSELGGAAGNLTGSATMALGQGAVTAGKAAYTRGATGAYPSMIDAASSFDLGISAEDFDSDDIRAGVIGSDAETTMTNVITNDSAFADSIYGNFNSIVNNTELNAEQMQDALITSYARYADVGAAMQNDDRIQGYASSYVPTKSNLKSMHAMHECLRAGAEARMDIDGSIYFSKPESMSDIDYKNLEYAFPKINYGYNAVSYYDEKKRKSYTPMDGYIGSGMIENMKRGDQNGGWGIPGLNDSTIDGVADVKIPGGKGTTSSDKFVGGAVKGGRQYNPGNSDSGVIDPLEQYYKEHPMEKFYREHPEMRPNVYT